MKIKNQFLISIIVFIIMFAIFGASVFVTQQQTFELTNQEEVSRDIQNRASNLAYLSDDYFLYQENSTLALWRTEFSSLSTLLSTLIVSTPEQQSLLNNVKEDAQRLNRRWNDVVTYLENAPRDISVRVLPEFQTLWSRKALQNQALIFEAEQLGQAFRSQIDQLNTTNIILIFALLALFGAYFITNYLITYRNTLKSISKLQAGIAVIGSGQLDYNLKTNEKDEIGEISESFNQMTKNLKTITASKTALEHEMKERKKAEKQLLESEERLNRSQEIAHLGGWELDLAKDKLSWSDEVYRIFGLKPQEFEATYDAFLQVVHPDDRRAVDAAYSDSLREGRDSYEIEHRIVRKSTGEIRVVHEKAENVRDQQGKIVRSIGMVHDITERKIMEAKLEEYSKHLENLVEERTKQLKDSERLATIGATAGMVGHDIRNPLQAITSDVYLIETELASTPESEEKKNALESLQEIQKNIDYVNKIVVDLQDFARPIAPKLEEADLEKIIHSALANLDIPENVTVKHSVTRDFPKLKTDPAYMQRILTNLANNAIQAMPNGGKLAITAMAKNGKAIITVEDNGEGIPENVRSKLFTPLVTTKSKGQGFGLSVVKRFTEGLGGHITFESEVGKGTKFIIELPV